MGRRATQRPLSLSHHPTLHHRGNSLSTDIRTEAVIPVEIHVPSRHTEEPLETEGNIEAIREELDLVEEIRTGAALREASLKQKIALRHDAKVIKREFKVDSLVLKRNHKDSRVGKLVANCEGPYRVRVRTENGAYYLENLQEKNSLDLGTMKNLNNTIAKNIGAAWYALSTFN